MDNSRRSGFIHYSAGTILLLSTIPLMRQYKLSLESIACIFCTVYAGGAVWCTIVLVCTDYMMEDDIDLCNRKITRGELVVEILYKTVFMAYGHREPGLFFHRR